MPNQYSFLLGFLFFYFPIFSFAQIDTIYIDRAGTKVSKDSAKYYRFLNKINEGLYKVEDYYLNDKLQMTGFYTSTEAVIKTGKYIFYDSIGTVQSEGEYNKGFKTGIWNYYYKKSTKLAIQNQFKYPEKGWYSKIYDSLTFKVILEGNIDKDSNRSGIWIDYFFNSDSIHKKINYVGGRLEGKQIEYYKKGAVKRIELYENFKMVDGQQFDEDGHKIKYFPALVYPKSPEPMWNYLGDHVSCFKSLLKKGKFVYRLLVHANGTISDIEIVSPVDESCKNEIIEKISKMKKWKPAKKEDIPFNYTYEGSIY